jgi:hypothetical protein
MHTPKPCSKQTVPLRGKSAIAAALVGAVSVGVALTALPNGAGAAPGAASSAHDRRVDLDRPTFSDPTNITNPLFPIDRVDQVIQLGAEGEVALRHEITLLDETKHVRWHGQDIETVVSQFVAYGDGEILEVATDYFAQADDGSVWYLGEDVTNYDNGRVENHDGTWLAGKDGPAGMIMPAHPRVGDVYRPENIPGFVFEEVTVMQTDMTVDGPTGPVHGAIRVQERLMDGSLEDKIFAPGYGEFQASVPASDELVTVAVATPTDDADQRAPRSLDTLSDAAAKLFDEGAVRNWTRLSALAADAHRAWAHLSGTGVPPLLATQTDDALDALDAALASRSLTDVRQAAIALEFATLDIEMRYEDLDEIDGDRLDVWLEQLRLHVHTRDRAGEASDRVILATIHDRLDG